MYFRTLREQRKRTLEDLASHLGVATSQASRLDTGTRGYGLQHVLKLASWYGLGAEEKDRVLALAANSRKRGWWQQVDLAASYRTLIGLERVADSISEYCSSVIPGLLQTPDYAYAAVAGSDLGLQAEQINRAVEVRMRRQVILDREKPPHLWVVIDEAALARMTGGTEVMRAQLNHLLSSATRPAITVQVIGFEYGSHPGVNLQFILLEMGGLPDVVYNEGVVEPSDSSVADDVRRHRQLWEALRTVALSPRVSRERIASYADRLLTEASPILPTSPERTDADEPSRSNRPNLDQVKSERE